MLQPVNDARAIVAEFLGTAFLLAGVVGSGIMAQRLFGANTGLTLLANAIATGGVLIAIIVAFGPISRAHFNPLVTLSDAVAGGIAWMKTPLYIVAQFTGAVAGTAIANRMFDLPVVFVSQRARHGAGMWLGEFLATFGLVAVLWGCVRFRPAVTPFAIAAYIVGAYWFTSSTSFENPAVTIGRSLTNTFTGIAPADTVGFIIAQIIGGGCATLLFLWLAPPTPAQARDLVVPHL